MRCRSTSAIGTILPAATPQLLGGHRRWMTFALYEADPPCHDAAEASTVS
jgi:hypothetical protein